MKTTANIYDQQTRISNLLHTVTTANIKRVHPDTGGSIHLTHNWGNEAALQYLEQYRNRQMFLYHLFNKYYHTSFCAQYPNHSASK